MATKKKRQRKRKGRQNTRPQRTETHKQVSACAPGSAVQALLPRASMPSLSSSRYLPVGTQTLNGETLNFQAPNGWRRVRKRSPFSPFVSLNLSVRVSLCVLLSRFLRVSFCSGLYFCFCFFFDLLYLSLFGHCTTPANVLLRGGEGTGKLGWELEGKAGFRVAQSARERSRAVYRPFPRQQGPFWAKSPCRSLLDCASAPDFP